MKTLLFILLFTVSISAQFNKMFLLFSGDAEWKPTDVDGNTLAYYDGDLGLTTSGWEDQVSTHDIVFANSPTITSNATPNRDAVLFNGTDESGTVATPTMNQPITIYIVMKQITWTSSDRPFDDGSGGSNKMLRQRTSTPEISLYAGAYLVTSPTVALGTYAIFTCVYNGASSELRTNLEVAVTGDGGANNGAGITLGSQTGQLDRFANVEIAYVIIRSGADNTSTQTDIINNLVTLCGLTL